MPPVLTLAEKKQERRLFLRQLRKAVYFAKVRLKWAQEIAADREQQVRAAERLLAKWKKARI